MLVRVIYDSYPHMKFGAFSSQALAPHSPLVWVRRYHLLLSSLRSCYVKHPKHPRYWPSSSELAVLCDWRQVSLVPPSLLLLPVYYRSKEHWKITQSNHKVWGSRWEAFFGVLVWKFCTILDCSPKIEASDYIYVDVDIFICQILLCFILDLIFGF